MGEGKTVGRGRGKTGGRLGEKGNTEGRGRGRKTGRRRRRGGRHDEGGGERGVSWDREGEGGSF